MLLLFFLLGQYRLGSYILTPHIEGRGRTAAHHRCLLESCGSSPPLSFLDSPRVKGPASGGPLGGALPGSVSPQAAARYAGGGRLLRPPIQVRIPHLSCFSLSFVVLKSWIFFSISHSAEQLNQNLAEWILLKFPRGKNHFLCSLVDWNLNCRRLISAGTRDRR